MQWLMTWQHMTPETQLSGEKGLLTLIDQLQGFEMPAKTWESEIFAKRIKNYDPMLLDRLCLMGLLGWGRLSYGDDFNAKRIMPSSIAPITFFMRDNAQWMPERKRLDNEDDLLGLSHIAKSIYIYLQSHGASFFTDIVNGVGHLKTEVELGLWELVTAGLTTADSFDNLRSLIDPRRRLLRKRRHATQHQYSASRWSLLNRSPLQDNNQRIDAMCWVLLKRYGVVFRDLLAKEKLIPRWRDLLIALRRMEDRGEIRGGYFVTGFSGEQFALPYAINSLRVSVL